MNCVPLSHLYCQGFKKNKIFVCLMCISIFFHLKLGNKVCVISCFSRATMPIATAGKEKDSGWSVLQAARLGTGGGGGRTVKWVHTTALLYTLLPPTTSPVSGASSIIMLLFPVIFCFLRIWEILGKEKLLNHRWAFKFWFCFCYLQHSDMSLLPYRVL